MEGGIFDKVNAVISKLQNKQKLERDKGFLEFTLLLQQKLSDVDYAAIGENIPSYCQDKFIKTLMLDSDVCDWETIIGSIDGMRCLIIHKSLTTDNSVIVLKYAEKCLKHDEVRVRLAFGKLLEELSKVEGIPIYQQCQQLVLNLIKDNLERQIDLPEEDLENSRSSTSSADIFHETAGWRYLESSMKCLQFIIQGCGFNFNSCVNQELLDLIFTALTHTNRFVRETGFYVCGSLVNIGHSDTSGNSILTYGEQFSKQIAFGLSDNWSQVRLAASVCARNFLLSFNEGAKREVYFRVLLPRMCLNRYYVAEGVRIYSQDSWKKVTNGKGRDFVAKYIDKFIDYYSTSTKADNHAVREAACACIAELGDKINKDSLKNHVSPLLNVLLETFNDDSWPVRDAACVACGKFVLNFVEESRGVKDKLYDLFLLNLRDPISSVRQGAAIAIGNYAKAYGTEALLQVVQEMKDAFTDITSQVDDVEKYSGMDSSPGEFGVIKRKRDNDMDLHTNQQMYSCGSLAPKMGRGNKENAPSGGCSSCTFKRESQPWERADGCLYLFASLLQDFKTCNEVVDLIPRIIQAAKYENYTQHVVFLETLCKQLPSIATAFGKKEFKKYIEMFLDLLFTAYASDTQLTKHAAEESILMLANFIGENIVKGRIENYNPEYVSTYENILLSKNGSSGMLRRPF